MKREVRSVTDNREYVRQDVLGELDEPAQWARYAGKKFIEFVAENSNLMINQLLDYAAGSARWQKIQTWGFPMSGKRSAPKTAGKAI